MKTMSPKFVVIFESTHQKPMKMTTSTIEVSEEYKGKVESEITSQK